MPFLFYLWLTVTLYSNFEYSATTIEEPTREAHNPVYIVGTFPTQGMLYHYTYNIIRD